MNHVFVIRGDSANLECDAGMLPTSAALGVRRWEKFVPHLHDRVARSNTEDLRSSRRLTAVLAGNVAPDPEIVLTVVPLYGFQETREPAPAVTGFFATAARALPASSGDGRSKRLIAMPFFGTRGGAGGNRKGPIRNVLFCAMREAASEHDVDAALVLQNEDAYALAKPKRAKDSSSVKISTPRCSHEWMRWPRTRGPVDSCRPWAPESVPPPAP